MATDFIKIYPYNQASESAKLLARSMTLDTRVGSVKLLRRENSTYKGNKAHTVINWGSSVALPDHCNKGRVINTPDAVAKAANKLTFFTHCSTLGDESPRIPAWTTNKAEVAQWLADGRTAFARKVLNGNSGEGIVDVIDTSVLDTVPDGTLFTMYVPKKLEWRIHVAFGKAFDVQRKAARTTNTVEGFTPNWRVRNFANGFVFERNGSGKPHADVIDQAVKATVGLGLDFGAVDVIWNEKHKQAFVLEVNTAPGIEASTLHQYSNMFIEELSK